MKMIRERTATIYALIIMICSFWAGLVVANTFFKEPAEQFLYSISYPEITDKEIKFNLFWQVWRTIKKDFVKQTSEKKMFYGALKGMVEGLEDPYSTYLNPEITHKFQTEMSGTFEGVGMEIGLKDNRLTVIAPLEGTPAAQAGLRPGDKILAIDKKSTIGIALEEAVNLIRGPKGTKVLLNILREGWINSKDFEIIRQIIKIQTVRWEMKKNQVAYLKLIHFYQETANDFETAASEILKKNPKTLILDLRNNPGGYLDSVIEIAKWWLAPSQTEVVTISRDALAREKEYQTTGSSKSFADLPTIILINQGSASGSEILAGALSDWGKATLLGEKTFGKGSIQELKIFPDGSSLKLTTAHWLTPKKRIINEIGVNPDIEIKMTEEDYKTERDPQLEKALELISK